MAGVRVHELAKRLGISSKELIEKLRVKGVQVKNHMSSLDEEQAERLFEEMKPKAVPSRARKTVTAEKKKAVRPRKAEKPKPAPRAREEGKKVAEARPVRGGEEAVTAAEVKPKAKAAAKKAVKVGVKRAERDGRKREKPAAAEREKPAARVIPLREEEEKEAAATAVEVEEAPPAVEEEEKKRAEAAAMAEREAAERARREEEAKREAEERVLEEELRALEEAEKPKIIHLGEAITVKELAAKLEVSPGEVLKKLLEMGKVSSINQILDMDVAVSLCKKFDFEAKVSFVEFEDVPPGEVPEAQEKLVERPPVVTVMGHVDHGKTSLLDAIRKTRVTDTEVGSITQHIGAYVVERMGKRVVFLDTPGHEAFTAMRARGAQVTDIVVLVVAADDGVMPQTREAVDHAKAAGVPVLVAVNKIDKPGANPAKVREELSGLGLVPEEWGGDTIFVDVSAKKNIGIESLLEMILLQAEIMELKADPDRSARGTIIESKLDRGRGPVVTVLLQKGTLTVGDPFISGLYYGKVRAMFSDRGKRLIEAGPSIPVEVLGISGLPEAGDSFVVIDEERRARQIGNLRLRRQREEEMAKSARITLDELYSSIAEGSIKELNLIIRADTQGSAQVLKEALENLSSDEVRVKVIHGSIGDIRETDISLAVASNAVVIGFNVKSTPQAIEKTASEKVDVRIYYVIYEAIESIKKAMEGMLEPEMREVVLGRAEVRELFHIPKLGTVAGCYVNEGLIRRDAEARLIRQGEVIYEGRIDSLKRFKEDVREVAAGYECGIGLEKCSDVKEGDVIEPFQYEVVEK